MGAIETKENVIETPRVESASKDTLISVDDPRSPDVERTPIVLPNPLFDPRSPSEVVDRTPIYLKNKENDSPYVRFKLENPSFVDSPLSAAASGKQNISEEEVSKMLNEKLSLADNNLPSENDKLRKRKSKSGQNLLRTVLFKAQNFETLNESTCSDKENSFISEIGESVGNEKVKEEVIPTMRGLR